ncbi:LysR substrate-binding domain-containing protein [Nocardia sp. R6R-6]|uniref:LysR substrate-binding domain-containing protein n=1 Tax=Nocardia sp. R6R-6 TaxID=3459303 RepID=UPI00403DEAFC
MDLRSLRYFVLVAEEGSVHAGARRALIAQPALSVALKALEREIGARLFERSYRGMALTTAGAALLPRARHILECAEEAKAAVKSAGAEDGPIFTIGLVEGRVAAAEMTGPILHTFQRRNPDVRMKIKLLNFVEQFDSVLHGDVDVAIVRSPYDHPDLGMVPLYREPSLLAVSPDHPLAREHEVSMESVLREPMLDFVHAPRGWRDFWNLTELRNEASGRLIASPALDLAAVSMEMARNPVVNPMSASAWRLSGYGEQTLRAVRLVEAQYSVAGVGYRRGNGNARVRSFVSVAQTIANQLVSLIPDCELVVAEAEA